MPPIVNPVLNKSEFLQDFNLDKIDCDFDVSNNKTVIIKPIQEQPKEPEIIVPEIPKEEVKILY